MHRISLPNEFLEGRNNVYLFDGEETVLVDGGSDTPEIRHALGDGFSEANLAVADLDRIYVTHYHIDHCGLLGWLVEQSNATVHAHPEDRPLIEGEEAAWSRTIALRRERLDEWGVPTDAINRLLDVMVDGAALYDGVDVEPVTDDTRIDLGETTLRALHTPGHSRGHLAFELPARNEVLTGDALLPVYTPNVGGADIRVEDPLASYVGTLERLADGSFDRGWPGHRHPIDSPTARAEEIIDHHERRAMRVLRTLVDVGPATPWTVSEHLFGDLEGVHILHGPGEAYAHLDHLNRAGLLVRTETGYQLTDDAADRVRHRDADTWPLSP
jgi:glyoxylase-like metal-dependent hydrolase (beta-lactamase superfamily II)